MREAKRNRGGFPLVAWSVALGIVLALPWTAAGQQAQQPAAVVIEPAAPVAMSDFVTIRVEDGTMRQVLNAFALQTGQNVVIGPDVEADGVNIQLNNVQWDEALEVILKPYGFGYRRIGDTIVISRLESLARLAEVEPMEMRVFNLQFVDAADVRELLQGQLSPRGSMSIMVTRGLQGWDFAAATRSASRSGTALGRLTRREDPRDPTAQAKSKTIVVTDIPSVLKQIEAVLQEVDVKPRQILVETRFMEVNASFLRDIGVELGPISVRSGGAGLSFEDSFYAVQPGAFVPSSASLVGNPPNVFGQLSFTSHSVDALLTVLQEDASSKVLSAPRIMTLNNQEAVIIIGEKYPIIRSNVSGATGDSITSTSLDYYENIGIQLNVVPQISGDNYINMIVHPAVSSIAEFETGTVASGRGDQDQRATALTRYPRIRTRETETQILLRNGETIIIGGLLEERDEETQFKVPLLGDIPMIKYLFRRSTVNQRTVDLLIFLSATIIDVDDMPEELVLREPVEVDLSGAEEGIRWEIVDEDLVPQAEEGVAPVGAASDGWNEYVQYAAASYAAGRY